MQILKVLSGSIKERKKWYLFKWFRDILCKYVQFEESKLVRIWFPWCLLFMSNKFVTFEAFGFILLGTSLKFWTTATEGSDFD